MVVAYMVIFTFLSSKVLYVYLPAAFQIAAQFDYTVDERAMMHISMPNTNGKRTHTIKTALSKTTSIKWNAKRAALSKQIVKV